MQPEEKKLLEETFELVKDNNVMLHKIRSAQKWASFMRIVYWLVIIGISIGAFYVLQPYVDKLMKMYNDISGMKQSVDSVSLQDILKNINIKQ